ncbi:hypothetical protein NFI96_008122, partial [Prochilodus magdalenae]
ALNVNSNANTTGDCCLAYAELSELMKDQDQQGYWQETGRWVGYEENYDLEAGRWGASHISYLTFKSLVQLRRTMNTGVVMLDREERSLSSIAEKIADEMVSKKEIRPGDREGVVQAFMQKSRPLTPDLSHLQPSPEGGTTPSPPLEMQTLLHRSEERIPQPLYSLLMSVLTHTYTRSQVFNTSAAFQGPERPGELTEAMADFMDCSIVIPPTEIQNEAMLAPVPLASRRSCFRRGSALPTPSSASTLKPRKREHVHILRLTRGPVFPGWFCHTSRATITDIQWMSSMSPLHEQYRQTTPAPRRTPCTQTITTTVLNTTSPSPKTAVVSYQTVME